MAGNIKGITIEFQGDTTKLDKALRQIKNSTKDIDTELRQVNNALKFNPTSVELWRQKQDLLKQKIQETENSLKELKNIQAQMDAQGVDKNSEAYRRVQREIISAESKLKTFNAELRKVGQVNLRAMSEQFKDMGDKLTAAGNSMRGISTAAAALAASIGALTVKSGKWADDINTMSKVYSIGTGELQKYAAAADLVDVDVETIAKSHVKLEKQMLSASKGTGASAEAFEKLGVEVTDANGNLRKGDDVWNDVIKALGSMENETERDALAMQLMGKSAAELNPLIEDGGETYKQVADTMAKYGLDFIDQETLDQANQFNDAIDTMKMVGMVAFQQLGTQLAAYLAPMMQKLVDLVGQLANWFSNLSPSTQAAIAAIAGIVAVVAPLLIGLGKVAFAISSIMSLASTLIPIIAGVGTTLLPIIAIAAAVVAAGVLLYKNWDTIKAKAIEIKDNIIATWNSTKQSVISTVNALKAGLSSAWAAIHSAVSSAWNAVKNAIITPIQNAKDTLIGIVNTIKSWFPIKLGNLFTFKLPHVSIGSKTVTVGDKEVTVPTFSVDWYAKGGIFDGAQLIGVGEAGPEAVVPLDKFWKKLDKIAEASNASPIVVNVYGSDNMSVSELAAAVEQRIIQMQKRRTQVWV